MVSSNGEQTPVAKITETAMDKEAQTEKWRDTKELIALTAHDLRNIINGIYGLNWILQDKINRYPDPEFEELTGLIASQCELGAELIAGLVLSYKQDILSLNKLLISQTRLYKYRTDRKDITLTAELPDKEIYVRTKRIALTRVLDNLFDNSLKFTTRRGQITIGLVQQDNKAIISVSDTGIGIPEHLQPLLFDRQPQIQREGTENESSTGLGLYISKQLTEELSGQLWFESIENKRTTFYLSLDTYNTEPTD
jgi:two-component system sensor histidine kinase VicK